ncbi:hypothetical protein [Actinoplanes sp. TFC3]|uniref:hypothetical protein n=1 Tax=Actinoplanes sp. TFC3 TaxID=1710355 RepID=UPI00082EEF03|nr:hypothetical protein [Actinoplanes sp. TFC3]
MAEDLGPPEAVLRSFGATEELVRLAGGKGGTWRAGEVVMKPAEGDDEVRWRCEILSALPQTSDFRIARPIRSKEGHWISYGWEATRFVPAQPDPQRVDDVIRAGEAFHAAVANVPRPSFLDTRSDPWANGEWLAWDGPHRPAGFARRPSGLLDDLLAIREDVDLPEQMVHGDLIGNVLFAGQAVPVVIDWAAYWRPPAWAYAVVVVDAMVWHGFDVMLARRYEHLPAWGQMLVRAAVFRLATWSAAGWSGEPEEAYRPVVRDVVNLVRGGG